jgi:hypothetical protein
MASPPTPLTAAVTSSSFWILRAARTSFIPRRPASTAVAAPIPDDAPVMTSTLSFSFRAMM